MTDVASTFKIDTGGSKTQVRDFLETLNGAEVTYHNYKRWQDNVTNMDQIIQSAIENAASQYERVLEEWKELRSSDYVKNAREKDIIPKELYDLALQMAKYMKDVIGWENIQKILHKTMNQKMANAIGEVKALDIESEAIKRMEAMVASNNELHKEIVTTRFKSMEEHFLTGMDRFHRDNIGETQKLVGLFSDVLKDLYSNNIELIKDLTREQAITKQRSEEMISHVKTLINTRQQEGLKIVDRNPEEYEKKLAKNREEEREEQEKKVLKKPTKKQDEKVDDDIASHFSDNVMTDEEPDEDDDDDLFAAELAGKSVR